MVNWGLYSTAALGLVAASPLANLEHALDQIVQETEDGFIVDLLPYYHLESSFYDNSMDFVEQFTLEGDDLHQSNVHMEWTETSATYEQSVSGKLASIGNNAWDVVEYAGLPSCRYAVAVYESYDIVAKIFFEFGASGFKHEAIYEVDLSRSIDDQTGRLELAQNLNVDITFGNTIIVDTEYEFTHFDKTDNFYSIYGGAPDEVSATSQITMSSKKCGNYFNSGMMKGNCPITLEMEGNWDTETLNVDASLTFKRAMITLETEVNGDIANIVLRAESPEGVVEMLIAGRFYGLYFSTSPKYLQQIRKGNSFLVLRFPGTNTLTTVLLPILMGKVAPWIEFASALEQNYEQIPNLIYYFDQFGLTFDDEFDFSKLIEESKIESDIFGSSLNEFLQEGAIGFNQMLMDNFFHCESMAEGFEQMRDYVTYLNGAEGEGDYKDTFGGIF